MFYSVLSICTSDSVDLDSEEEWVVFGNDNADEAIKQKVRTELVPFAFLEFKSCGPNSNNELKWLANHMGHSLAIHKNFYRLQEQTLELAKVSKLLIATDDGQAHKFAGKSLD
ncbi:hypothetical protein KUTeg_009469 [Tegillarca granosa]|uniref:Uncharacterized protein n=1 Tax=Tegillarca granosa TaxID=220873 RepID=A0ABQ9F3Z1_TEGGR|nr:hypothetical protein KUTeg_009469 [Tegillarca granosa]